MEIFNKIARVGLIFLLGASAGYWYRFAQVETTFQHRIEALREDQREISRMISHVDGRLVAIEAMFKPRKGGRK